MISLALERWSCKYGLLQENGFSVHLFEVGHEDVKSKGLDAQSQAETSVTHRESHRPHVFPESRYHTRSSLSQGQSFDHYRESQRLDNLPRLDLARAKCRFDPLYTSTTFNRPLRPRPRQEQKS